MKKIFIIISLFLITNSLFSQQDKNKIFTNLKKKYGNAKSIILTFGSSEKEANNYILRAKIGNKFHIAMDNRKIICDGKTVWNYNIVAKNVIISEFANELSGLTLDYFFFNIFDKLKPVELKTELSSSSKKNYILDLNCTDNSIEIKKVSLFLDSAYSKIIAIKIKTNDIEQKWYVKDLQINKQLKDDEFIFKIPNGVETIDYR